MAATNEYLKVYTKFLFTTVRSYGPPHKDNSEMGKKKYTNPEINY